MSDRQEKLKSPPSAREAAYLALLSAHREESFIADWLEKWVHTSRPSPRDVGLAREIAYGSCRMSLALNEIARQCTPTGKLSLKTKEKLLLHTALYQRYFLERIPLYAIIDETLAIARRYCHERFAKFLGAVLHKIEHWQPCLPEGNSPEALSLRFSYPLYFVKELLTAYGETDAIPILQAGNQAAPLMFRIRHSNALDNWPAHSYTYVENGFQTALLNDPSTLPQLVESTSVYIQNATPSLLMHTLNEHAPIPKRILDLCASPGGKLLLAHDLYPHASLHANDVSSQKLERLKENIIKYNLKAALSCGLGEKISSQELFDLIIIDAPCSNTGVLNKRPEARWRVAENTMKETTDLQFELLKHAETLLAPKGELWYLTCSILPEENEKMMNRISQATHLKPRVMKTMLPTHTGWDGGFGCALVKI